MTIKFTNLNLALKSRENEHAASPGPSHSNAEPRLHGPAASSLPASTTALHTPDPQFGGQMSQAPAHFRGLYLLFTLSGMFPSRSPRERHRYYPHFTGGVNRCMERLRPFARSQSGFAVPALVSKHNSASNLSLHSGHSNWFVPEPVANLSQVHKDLRSKPRLLGRKVFFSV